MSSSRPSENIMHKLRPLDESKDLFTYNGEEVKCDCGLRVSRLMMPKFERYFACHFWKCKFENNLEVVADVNAVRREIKAAMEAKLAELEARKDVEWEVQKEVFANLKNGYIAVVHEELEKARRLIEHLRHHEMNVRSELSRF